MVPSALPAVLPGSGATDYARYMRTDELLRLQKEPAQWVHPDELLFQIAHQSTELWLKLTRSHLSRALAHLEAGQPAEAELLIDRAAEALRLITEHLRILRSLPPAHFAVIRRTLGNGSGFESPGWRLLRAATTELDIAYSRLLSSLRITVVDVYRGQPSDPLYRLAEALIELDERIALWRVEHYSVATRVIGHGVRGTGGTPVDSLPTLISHRRFPTLWEARTAATRTGSSGICPSEGRR
ncbi:tryptophan 2,3-dioxygenase family protein [Micromonospora sp. HUAS LYJ1]|uniref:tryptophan 2,3-dioxygenase family protein n=1 Tax=Micromonospora sp. HUAS LYJ1 TaxID=3061626 RepID=UPI00267321EF|nr:tryptophan 2,3-dioxygenase family protein [Micromonospora sp. HUAS LYJ1]WKU03489.1 tryptophan 2,3-dioxygenase family protein [Micromonospora sp. HUAS LYJ1]